MGRTAVQGYFDEGGRLDGLSSKRADPNEQTGSEEQIRKAS